MATYDKGVMGDFKGTVGTVVGAKWKGIPYMRSTTRKIIMEPSLKQLKHRARFGLVSKFVHSIKDLLMQCYPDSPVMTSVNHAFKDIYDNAITGEYPNFQLDYHKILISRGELHNAKDFSVSSPEKGNVEFKWADNSDGVMAKPDDRAVVLVHCPETQQSRYNFDGPQRQECLAILDADIFEGKMVKAWIAFISAGKEAVSTSVYLGELIVRG